MTPFTINLIGIIGLAGILIGFVLEHIGKVNKDHIPYNLLNLAGSGLLLWYATILKSVPFIILNVIWLFVSITYLAKRGIAGVKKL